MYILYTCYGAASVLSAKLKHKYHVERLESMPTCVYSSIYVSMRGHYGAEPEMELSTDFQSNKKKFHRRLNSKFLHLNSVLFCWRGKHKKREKLHETRFKEWCFSLKKKNIKPIEDTHIKHGIVYMCALCVQKLIWSLKLARLSLHSISIRNNRKKTFRLLNGKRK